jgi:AcrR family transcriptional regulator
MARTSLKPRRTPGQERSIETQRRLLEAAARVFATHGYARGTTNRIAEDAGMSIGSLYQYYPNKDAILLALQIRHVEEGVAALGPLLGAPRERAGGIDRWVQSCIDAIAAVHRRDPGLHRVLFEEAPWPPDLHERFRAAEMAAVAAAEEAIRGDPTLAPPDVRLAAYLMVVTIESLTHRYFATPPRDVGEDCFRQGLRRLVIAHLREA